MPNSAPETYRSITLANFEQFRQIQALPEEVRKTIRVVGTVLPFKSNKYLVDRLIDWKNYAQDPIFALTFPQKEMLEPKHYAEMEKLIDAEADPDKIKETANKIRLELNPHPAGQLRHNLPVHHGKKLTGMQHKYRETILFFPIQGQTCHAYCSFCFRWAQFVGMEGLKFATREAQRLAEYLREHPYTTDVLFTGGDPLIMKTRFLKAYIEELLKVDSLRSIRIGSKALAYWPYRVLTDDDSQELLELLQKIADSGKHLSIMAHYNHFVELSTPEAREAVAVVRKTGAQLRTQSPLLRHINDSAEILAKMWRKQTKLGMIPYYLFIARDTGARRYFEIPLVEARETFRNAFKSVSGLARTVRGPSMSATPGKARIVGIAEVRGEKVFILNFHQARNPDWVGRPFFAKFDPKATWLDQLKPAFGEKEFFYEAGLRELLDKDSGWKPATPDSTPSDIS